MARRIKYGREPVLHLHRYIAVVGCRRKFRGKLVWHRQFRYLVNLKEVRNLRDSLPKGKVLEVFEAHHNFREAWEA